MRSSRARRARPRPRSRDALGGVLCRCTGYRKIVEAVIAAARRRGARRAVAPAPAAGARSAPAIARRRRHSAKVTGAALFGADGAGPTRLTLRAVRSPHAHARFAIGDLGALDAAHPGLVRVLIAADVPGQNRYGIYPTGKDQPVLADGYVRYRGEAVAALVGDAATVARIRDDELPIAWDAAAAAAGPRRRADADGAPGSTRARPGTSSSAGRVARGDVDAALAGVGGHRDGDVRDEPRRARLHRARGGLRAADRRPASRSSRPPRRRTWTATRSPSSWASRPDARPGHPDAPAAAASAASSTSPSSRSSRSRRGCSIARSAASARAPNRCASTTKRHPARDHGDDRLPTPTAR